jgi:hypothetical protein
MADGTKITSSGLCGIVIQSRDVAIVVTTTSPDPRAA